MSDSNKNRPYWRKIFRATLSETGIISALSGAGGALIGAILAFNLGFAKREEMPQMFFIIVVSAVGGVLVEFTIRFILLPAKVNKEQEDRLDELKNQLAGNNVLQLEIIHPANLDILTSRKTYRIKVKNTHSSKTVKNLKVWLCEIKWPQSIEKPLIWSGIKFPLQLPKKEGQDNSLAHELEGRLDMEFDLMFVSTPNFGKRIINLAPFQPKCIGTNSLFKSVDSDLSFDIDILPKDDSKLVFKFKVTGGEGDVDTVTESYILNIPPLLPETSVENTVQNLNSLCQNFDKYLPVFEKN